MRIGGVIKPRLTRDRLSRLPAITKLRWRRGPTGPGAGGKSTVASARANFANKAPSRSYVAAPRTSGFAPRAARISVALSGSKKDRAAVLFRAALVINLGMVVVTLYLFAGLAVAHAIVRQRKANRGWLFGMYALIVLALPQMSLLIAGIGVVDTWIDFRRRLAGAA